MPAAERSRAAAPRGRDASSGRVIGRGAELPATLGRYSIVGRIGKGGMAQVLHGRLTSVGGFERDVAIKLLLPEYAAEPDFVDMLLDEARIAGAIQHPNVVQVLDLGREEELFYIVMEYVGGADLRSRMRGTLEGRLPVEAALFVCAEVLRGLEAVHCAVDRDGQPRRIVHRDVSPANVLIDGRGGVKLGDFGIAHASSRLTRTRNGAVKGKLRYMAPEQMAARAVDHRADLYAVGVMLAEILLSPSFIDGGKRRPSAAPGQPPMFVWSRARAQQEFPGLLPDDVARILDRALTLDAESRYPDAGAFRRDLAVALHSRRPGFGPDELRAAFDKLSQEARAFEEPGGSDTDHQDPTTPARAQAAVQLAAPARPPATPLSRTTEPMPVIPMAPVPMPVQQTPSGPLPLPPPPSGPAPLPSTLMFPSGPPATFEAEQPPTTPRAASPWSSPSVKGLTSIQLRGQAWTRALKSWLQTPHGRRLFAIGVGAAVLVVTTVVLVAVLASRSGGPPAPVVTPVPVTTPVAVAPVAPHPAATGTLVVEGKPGTTITLGATAHAVPCQLELSPGQYAVKLQRPGKKRPVSRIVTITAGEQTLLE